MFTTKQFSAETTPYFNSEVQFREHYMFMKVRFLIRQVSRFIKIVLNVLFLQPSRRPECAPSCNEYMKEMSTKLCDIYLYEPLAHVTMEGLQPLHNRCQDPGLLMEVCDWG